MNWSKIITTIWNILITIGTIGVLVFTVVANIMAYTTGVGWLGWIIADVILLFVDYMFVKGWIKRFIKKDEQEQQTE